MTYPCQVGHPYSTVTDREICNERRVANADYVRPTRCVCGGRLETTLVKSRAGTDVLNVCSNRWADCEHRPVENEEAQK